MLKELDATEKSIRVTPLDDIFVGGFDDPDASTQDYNCISRLDVFCI
jgi:hypothetical protein